MDSLTCHPSPPSTSLTIREHEIADPLFSHHTDSHLQRRSIYCPRHRAGRGAGQPYSADTGRECISSLMLLLKLTPRLRWLFLSSTSLRSSSLPPIPFSSVPCHAVCVVEPTHPSRLGALLRHPTASPFISLRVDPYVTMIGKLRTPFLLTSRRTRLWIVRLSSPRWMRTDTRWRKGSPTRASCQRSKFLRTHRGDRSCTNRCFRENN
jgi:hypothetical protein